jgi:hypothetical protein
MSNEKAIDFAIDEFKALRDEVKRCESESLSITLYIFTAVLLAVGLTDRASLTKHTVPILVQTALLWAMHRHLMLSTLRIRLSTYIQVMLEPEMPGIHWEGRNDAFDSINYRGYYFSNKALSWCLHRFTQLFFLLTAIGIFLSINSVMQMHTRDASFYIFAAILGVLHLMSTLLMLKCVFLCPTSASYIKIWQGIKQSEQALDEQKKLRQS